MNKNSLHNIKVQGLDLVLQNCLDRNFDRLSVRNNLTYSGLYLVIHYQGLLTITNPFLELRYYCRFYGEIVDNNSLEYSTRFVEIQIFYFN